MRSGKIRLTLLFGGGLALALPFCNLSRVMGDEDRNYSFTRTTLAQLQTNPTSFKCTRVKFLCVLHRIEDVWAPFYTPFIPEQYLCFSVWDVTRQLWAREDRLADFPYLFIKKSSGELNNLIQAEPYTILEIGGIVQNDFNRTPWIEAIQVRKHTCRHLTNASLRHLIVGSERQAAGEHATAVPEFEIALGMKLPPEEEFHAHRSLAKSYFILANYRAAKEHASLAQRLRPDDELQKIWLASRDTLDATPGRRLRDDRVRSVQETGEPTTAKGASSPATAEAAPTPAATEAKNPEAKPAPAVPAAEAEAATKTPAAAEPPAAANGDATAGAVPALEHVVAPGDTLAALAEKYYEDANQWHRIFEANQPQIGENYALKPGSKLRIPQPTPRPGAPETPKPEEAGKPPAAEAPEKSEEPKPQACDSNREELTVEVVRLRSALLVAEEAIRSGHEQLAQRDHALARLLAWKANAVEQEQAGRARDAALARRLRDSVAAAEREADEAIRHGAALLTPATGAGPAVASAENPAATADFSLSGPQMDRLRAVLETVRKEQARLAGEVVTRDQRIAELTSQVQALSREVATCTQLRGENARLRSEVREKDQQLAGLRETLTEREVALAQLRRESGVQGASINLSAGQRRAETEKAGQGRLERAPRTVAAPATVDADESSLTEERPRARGRRTQDERRSPDALSRAPEAQQPAAPRAAAPQAGSSNTPAPPPPGASRGPSPTEDLDASSIVETLLTLSGAR